MPAYRDKKHGTFYASFYYTDFTGARRKKMKRGFRLKRDAQEWSGNSCFKGTQTPI